MVRHPKIQMISTPLLMSIPAQMLIFHFPGREGEEGKRERERESWHLTQAVVFSQRLQVQVRPVTECLDSALTLEKFEELLGEHMESGIDQRTIGIADAVGINYYVIHTAIQTPVGFVEAKFPKVAPGLLWHSDCMIVECRNAYSTEIGCAKELR